jgi:type IV pilus assembly protein PilM
VELRQIAESPLEPGIVEGGEVQDVERLAAALKTFFNEHKLPKRGIRVGVANNRIGIRTIDLEGIDDPRQVANAVRFRAQEALPIPIDEAVLDFQILSDTPGAIGAGPSKRVLLVVAYRELVLTYAKACQQAGLHLLGVDLEAFALLRALSSPIGAEDREQGALIAVSIGSERSVLAVTDGSTCEFARVGWQPLDRRSRAGPRARLRGRGALEDSARGRG